MTDLRRSALKRIVKLPRGSRASDAFFNLCLKLFRFEAGRLDAYENHGSQTLDDVFGASKSEVAKPCALGETKAVYQEDVPPIQPILFSDVDVSSDSSILRFENRVLIPKRAFDNSDRFNWVSGHICRHQFEGMLFFDKLPEQRLSNGICAFGNGATNWYHWLVEILPTVMLAQNLGAEYDDFPLLVPEEILKGATFHETLKLYVGNRRVVPLEKNKQYRINRLVLIPPPAAGPINMSEGYWPMPGDYVNNIGAMREFRTRTLDQLGIEYEGTGPKKVFLARPAGTRGYNQDQILEVVRARGFHIARTEKLTFREQVQLFHDADFVAGPSGAAWANSLFMRPGSKSLNWTLKEYAGGCFFSNLAHVAGSQMTYCFLDADKEVRSTMEGFSASYILPVDVFSEHVDAILSQ